MKKNLVLRWCWLSVAMLVTGTDASASEAVESPSAPRADSNALNLPEAVRLALENNPDLHASRARVEAAAGRAYQARKWKNPELELNAEDWPVSNGNGFSDAKQTIGILQTLPYPGKKSLDRRIGGAGVKLSEAELAVRQTEVVRDVKAAFFRALASEQLVTSSIDLLSVAESSAATARKRVDAGSAAYQEQLRAEVQLEQARTELADFERDLATSRQALASVIGRPDLANASLSGAMAESPDSDLLGAVGENALDRHPSATAARADVERADLEQRRARLEPYPDVRVGISGGRIGETDQSIIQLGLAVPLPILDTGKGKKREARANVDVAAAELVRVQYALLREWTVAQNRYRTAVEQVRNYRERLLPKATEALRLVRTGFEQGKFGFIDLLDTQRTTAEARQAYQHKLLEMNIAHAELEALLRPQSVQPSTTK
jgi:cobalt-zinc-cadmium efflux system outer membrane protein